MGLKLDKRAFHSRRGALACPHENVLNANIFSLQSKALCLVSPDLHKMHDFLGVGVYKPPTPYVIGLRH